MYTGPTRRGNRRRWFWVCRLRPLDLLGRSIACLLIESETDRVHARDGEFGALTILHVCICTRRRSSTFSLLPRIWKEANHSGKFPLVKIRASSLPHGLCWLRSCFFSSGLICTLPFSSASWKVRWTSIYSWRGLPWKTALWYKVESQK